MHKTGIPYNFCFSSQGVHKIIDYLYLFYNSYLYAEKRIEQEMKIKKQ